MATRTKKEVLDTHDKAMRRVTLEACINNGLTFQEVLDAFARRRTEREQRIFEIAKRDYSKDGSCEIDPNAFVSCGDADTEPGGYVMAWVWIARDEDEEG